MTFVVPPQDAGRPQTTGAIQTAMEMLQNEIDNLDQVAELFVTRIQSALAPEPPQPAEVADPPPPQPKIESSLAGGIQAAARKVASIALGLQRASNRSEL